MLIRPMLLKQNEKLKLDMNDKRYAAILQNKEQPHNCIISTRTKTAGNARNGNPELLKLTGVANGRQYSASESARNSRGTIDQSIRPQNSARSTSVDGVNNVHVQSKQKAGCGKRKIPTVKVGEDKYVDRALFHTIPVKSNTTNLHVKPIRSSRSNLENKDNLYAALHSKSARVVSESGLVDNAIPIEKQKERAETALNSVQTSSSTRFSKGQGPGSSTICICDVCSKTFKHRENSLSKDRVIPISGIKNENRYNSKSPTKSMGVHGSFESIYKKSLDRELHVSSIPSIDDVFLANAASKSELDEKIKEYFASKDGRAPARFRPKEPKAQNLDVMNVSTTEIGKFPPFRDLEKRDRLHYADAISNLEENKKIRTNLISHNQFSVAKFLLYPGKYKKELDMLDEHGNYAEHAENTRNLAKNYQLKSSMDNGIGAFLMGSGWSTGIGSQNFKSDIPWRPSFRPVPRSSSAARIIDIRQDPSWLNRWTSCPSTARKS